MCKTFIRLFVPAALTLWAFPAAAQNFTFSTGSPDGRIATASRPESAGRQEIESADDFILGGTTALTGASFTGLLPTGLPLSNVSQVRVEIYRVFSKDSQFPPSNNVPTRVNSPSDVAFDDRDSASSNLTFAATSLNSSFTANNSVLNGIHAHPTPFTGGEGAVTGNEVRFDVNFTEPFLLPADHYFFIPQVLLTNGDFLWLSAPKPNGAPDLQSWIRNSELDPDWLRIGTDIVGAGAFNGTFSLNGQSVPEPSAVLMLGAGLTVSSVLTLRRRNRRK